jgi:hypothetical protein
MEHTFKGLSLLYNHSHYEMDLFEIFKYVTIFEKKMVQYEVKYNSINSEEKVKTKREIKELKKEFIRELENKLFYFKVRYEDSLILDSMKIKNKLMIVSILRKLYSVTKPNNQLFRYRMFPINDDLDYSLEIKKALS